MSRDEHADLAQDMVLTCAVLTTSDTRTLETDRSGQLMRSLLEDDGHQVPFHRVVTDDIMLIRKALDDALDQVPDVILCNGGTGISKRDSTYEAVEPLLEKVLPGFGELFRMLSYEEIGPATILSRAIAGVYKDTLIFCTPGSTGAVRLAMERLIVPEIRHFVWEILRHAQ
jgi:molybdopterin adenylyltransferase